MIPVAKPPWTKLGRLIESKIRKSLFDFQLLEGASKLAVALSGGKDSLTLLYMLKAILGRGFPNLELFAIHVSGAFSCGAGLNQHFLSAICRELGVPFIERHAEQKREDLECYSCSRKRRTLIFEAAKEVGANSVAFGHHRDDHAQTVLMNLLHKGEFAGNLPKLNMTEYGITIIRPLIYVEEKEITAFATLNNFRRITCQCPVGQNSMRKKVDQLLTDLEELYPNARENIASAGLKYGSKKASVRGGSAFKLF
jgi:tRNA 2-thiocytidine biosynthesis protein TtcA